MCWAGPPMPKSVRITLMTHLATKGIITDLVGKKLNEFFFKNLDSFNLKFLYVVLTLSDPGIWILVNSRGGGTKSARIQFPTKKNNSNMKWIRALSAPPGLIGLTY